MTLIIILCACWAATIAKAAQLHFCRKASAGTRDGFGVGGKQ